MDQSQRTREMMQQMTRSSAEQLEKWALLPGRVVVTLTRESAHTPNGQLCLFTVINLVSRLFPIITEVSIRLEGNESVKAMAPLFQGQTVKEAIARFIELLNPPALVKAIELPETRASGISLESPDSPSGKVCIASDGWNVLLSTTSPVFFSGNYNPIGAMAAACFGVSEIFKRVVATKASLMHVSTENTPRMDFFEGRCAVSMLSYDEVGCGAAGDNPRLPEIVPLGELSLIGVGAVGGACLYALTTVNMTGDLAIVDPDVVNPPNLNRYPYAVEGDATALRSKVEVVGDILRQRADLHLDLYRLPFVKYRDSHRDWPRHLVVCAVDSAELRRNIQWELPGIILDAAVSRSSFYVHRVQLGKSACLCCTHPPPADETDPLHSMAEYMGIDEQEFKSLYYDNAPMDAELAAFFAGKAQVLGIPPPTIGMTLKDWTTLHCGQLRLTAGADVTVPVPFATFLPGVLLAGEVIKERCFPDLRLRYRVNHDVFCTPCSWLKAPLLPKSGCPVCSDEAVRRAYDARYPGKV